MMWFGFCGLWFSGPERSEREGGRLESAAVFEGPKTLADAVKTGDDVKDTVAERTRNWRDTAGVCHGLLRNQGGESRFEHPLKLVNNGFKTLDSFACSFESDEDFAGFRSQGRCCTGTNEAGTILFLVH